MNQPPSVPRRPSGSLLRTVRAVAWSFLGMRKAAVLQQDMEQAQPAAPHRGRHWRGSSSFCCWARAGGELGCGALSGRTHPTTDKQSREQEKQ
jgi:hypothetical protein